MKYVRIFVCAMLTVAATNTLADVPPTGAIEPVVIRTFGRAWFNDSSTSAALITDDNKRLIRYLGGLTVWDIATGDLLKSETSKERRTTACTPCGKNQILVAWQVNPDSPCVYELLDSTTLKLIRPIKIPGLKILQSIAVSTDGSRIAVAGIETNRLRAVLCDGKTGDIVHEFPELPFGRGPRYYPRFVFSGDGQTLLYSDEEKNLSLVSTRDGSLIPSIKKMTAETAALSNDGKTLAVVSQFRLSVFDVTSGEELHFADPQQIPQPPEANRREPRYRAVFRRPGSEDFILIVEGGGYKRFDANKRPLELPGPSDLPAAAGQILFGFSADGSRILIGDYTSHYRVFDNATGKPITPEPQTVANAAFVLVSPDGSSLIMADTVNALYRFDIATGQVTAQGWPDERGGARAIMMLNMDYFDHGKTLLLGTGGSVQARDSQTLAISPQQPKLPANLPGNINAPILISADGKTTLSINAHQDVLWTDLASGRQINLLEDQPGLPRPVTAKAISDDGNIACLQIGPSLRLLDLPSKKWGRNMQISFAPEIAGGVGFSPDGHWLFDFEGGQVAAFSVQRALQDTTPDAPVGPGERPQAFFEPTWTEQIGAKCDEADIGPSGELLATPQVMPGENTACVRLFEAATGRPALSLAIPHDRKTTVRFVPHQLSLIVVDSMGIGRLLDLQQAFKDSHPELFDPAVSIQDLWNKFSEPDPSAAFAAGVSLTKRDGFIEHVRTVSPLAKTQSKLARIQELIVGLGSTDQKEREKSHKALEAEGPAAGAAVRAALAKHPGGELEARLTDIARLDGADHPGGDAPEVETDADRTDRRLKSRLLQLLDWMPGHEAMKQRDRIAGDPGTPSTRP